MKGKTVFSIFMVGLFLYSIWRVSDYKTSYPWTESHVESLIDTCINSSKTLSSIEYSRARSICSCGVQKFRDSFSDEEIIVMDKQSQNKQLEYLKPLILDCAFPQLFEHKHVIISDTTQFSWISDSIASIWIPSIEDYKIAESILVKAVIANQNDYWTGLDDKTIKGYYRQYIFYKSMSGDSIVYINAFCEIFQYPVDSSGAWIFKPYDWKNKLQFVDDGGDCYWSIKIILSKMSYFDFKVN